MKNSTKTQMVADCLRDRIEMRYYPEGRLPREFDLAAELKVGRITVRKALEALEQDDLIERKKHAGTFIKTSCADKNFDNTAVGILMHSRGHVYSELHYHISRNLLERGLTAHVIDTTELNTRSPAAITAPLERAVARMLRHCLKNLIVHATSSYCLPYLNEIIAKSPVFFDFYDFADETVKSGVWFDYEKAGYLGGKYLMENGCRHPLLIGQPLPLKVRMNPVNYKRHRENLIISGYCRALREYGLDGQQYVLDAGFNNDKESLEEEILTEIMRNRKLRPDGLLGSSDSKLLYPLKTALSLGIKIPRELKVVGIGNTPWSAGHSLMPFSSVDLQLTECGKKIVEQMLIRPSERKNIYIETKLIRRS